MGPPPVSGEKVSGGAIRGTGLSCRGGIAVEEAHSSGVHVLAP